jgi:hypothetical protein
MELTNAQQGPQLQQDQNPTIEARLTALETKVEDLEFALKQAQVTASVAHTRGAGGIPNALVRRLEKHGIRIQDEDQDEAQGSGSERWGGAGDWTKTEGQGITDNTGSTAAAIGPGLTDEPIG